MALHPEFPTSPYAPLIPAQRWFSAEYRSVVGFFTKIVGEVNTGGFELAFAAFLEAAPDVAAFTKNYLAINFTEYKV